MRYAEEQVTRPQHEDGCDFGTERRVLVRRGPNDLLHVPGHKIWAGRGNRRYVESEIALYGPAIESICHQEAIHKGRLMTGTWESLAAQIYVHLGQEFPVSLISMRATLLLDEPGEIAGPPGARSEQREYPHVEDKVLFRCVADPGGTLRILAYTVKRQAHGCVTLIYRKRATSCNLSTKTIWVESLAENGFAASPEGAADLVVQASMRAVEAWHRAEGH